MTDSAATWKLICEAYRGVSYLGKWATELDEPHGDMLRNFAAAAEYDFAVLQIIESFWRDAYYDPEKYGCRTFWYDTMYVAGTFLLDALLDLKDNPIESDDIVADIGTYVIDNRVLGYVSYTIVAEYGKDTPCLQRRYDAFVNAIEKILHPHLPPDIVRHVISRYL